MKINKFNKDFTREGYWELYYVSGKCELSSKGYFTNGIKMGLWEHYNKNGDIKKKIYFY
jgi:antitoxin component YwqK of YwqJK toxin-antitoxin module